MIYSHTISHEPDNQAARYWDEASTPLFPFGHGLSYGRSTYANLTRRPGHRRHRRHRHRVGRGHQHRRTGTADEVVQLYIHQRHGSASRPVRELKGFQRVTLAAGETRTAAVPDRAGRAHATGTPPPKDWVPDASTFDVWVGSDSTAPLAATFTVTK